MRDSTSRAIPLTPLSAPLAEARASGSSVEVIVNIYLIRTALMTARWRHDGVAPVPRRNNASAEIDRPCLRTGHQRSRLRGAVMTARCCKRPHQFHTVPPRPETSHTASATVDAGLSAHLCGETWGTVLGARIVCCLPDGHDGEHAAPIEGVGVARWASRAGRTAT